MKVSDARAAEIVMADWDRIRPITHTITQLFYERLFETNPRSRSLFTRDMNDQRTVLVQMIEMIVDSLPSPQSKARAVRASGIRHAGYGVKASDYIAFRDALLWALEAALGDDWNKERRIA